MSLIAVGQPAQGRLEDLAGLADKSRSVHDGCGVGEGAGNADADRARSAKQWILIRAAGVALDQYLAFKGITLRGVGAGVKQIGIAPDDLAIPEHDNTAALAGTTVLQADMDRIKAVFHGAPVTVSGPAE